MNSIIHDIGIIDFSPFRYSPGRRDGNFRRRNVFFHGRGIEKNFESTDFLLHGDILLLLRIAGGLSLVVEFLEFRFCG